MDICVWMKVSRMCESKMPKENRTSQSLHKDFPRWEQEELLAGFLDLDLNFDLDFNTVDDLGFHALHLLGGKLHDGIGLEVVI